MPQTTALPGRISMAIPGHARYDGSHRFRQLFGGPGTGETRPPIPDFAHFVRISGSIDPGRPAESGVKLGRNVSIPRRFFDSLNRPRNSPNYPTAGIFPNDNESASYPAPTVSKLVTNVGENSSRIWDCLRNIGRTKIVHFVTVIFFPYLTHLAGRC